MTYIEFFDPNVPENICTSLARIPERVVLIGDKMKALKEHAQRYHTLFMSRGHEVEFICRSISKNKIQDIVDYLCILVDTYEDCVFDLTGGEDLYLVAAGIVAVRKQDKHIQLQRFNLRNGTVIDCDSDGITIKGDAPIELTVEENIRAYGGDVVYDTIKPEGTHIWELDEELEQDIRMMWDICKSDARLWNTQLRTFEVANSLAGAAEDLLTVTVSLPALNAELKSKGGRMVFVRGIIDRLCYGGAIVHYEQNEDQLTISFKNDQVKRCLTKAGQILELMVYSWALAARDDRGEPVYNDVMTGVCIDWDGKVHAQSEDCDTENEIDVLMMHGVVPVFVSCKNGAVKIDELYKLDTVAKRFGGRYAKKVLIATALDTPTLFDEQFRQRARDMDIRVVENIQDMSEAEALRVIRSLWCN